MDIGIFSALVDDCSDYELHCILVDMRWSRLTGARPSWVAPGDVAGESSAGPAAPGDSASTRCFCWQ